MFSKIWHDWYYKCAMLKTYCISKCNHWYLWIRFLMLVFPFWTFLLTGPSFHCSTETQWKELLKQFKIFKKKSTQQSVLIFEGHDGSTETIMQHVCNKLEDKKKTKKFYKYHRYVSPKVKICLWLNCQKILVESVRSHLLGAEVWLHQNWSLAVLLTWCSAPMHSGRNF